jgi:hypothetical protein
VTRAGRAWDIRVDDVDWRAGERIALSSEGPIDLTYGADGTLDVRRARVVSTAGALTVQGRWGGDKAPSDLGVTLETLDLAALLGPVAADVGLRGVVTGKAHLVGPARHADWTVDLEGTDLKYRVYAARRLVARGRFGQEAWQVEDLKLDTGDGQSPSRARSTGPVARPGPPTSKRGTRRSGIRPAGRGRSPPTASPRAAGGLRSAGGRDARIPSLKAELGPSVRAARHRDGKVTPGWGQGAGRLVDFDYRTISFSEPWWISRRDYERRSPATSGPARHAGCGQHGTCRTGRCG